MDNRIRKEDYLEAFEKIQEKLNSLSSKEQHITAYTKIAKGLEFKINEYYKSNNLPRLSFSVINPTTENRKEDSKAINYPNIRCVAVYDIEGKKNRLSIFIGRLQDFPNGKDSQECLMIAKNKAFNHLCKSFPHLFTDKPDETGKIDISTFFKSYEVVNDLNKKLSVTERVIENYIKDCAEIQREINELRNNNFLPQINLTAIYPDVSIIKDLKHSISYPHLRCMATYNIANTKKRINIYIGKLDEFPEGVNDPKAIQIAREKSFVQLSKLFPLIYANMSS